MSKRQVIILWCIALVLAVAVTAVKFSQQKTHDTTTKRGPGQTLFENFPGNDVAQIQIRGAHGTTTLVSKNSTWTVAERADYPAKAAAVNGLLRTLSELKITRSIQAGPSLAPRFGMDDNATGPEEHGTTILFRNTSGEEIAGITLGKNVGNGAQTDSAPASAASGRFIRNRADESGFYAVNEMFADISDTPESWLLPDFFSIEKIRTITITQPGKTELEWKVTRPDENSAFTLDPAVPGETLGNDKDTALKSLFSYPAFKDVIPTETVNSRIIPESTRKATITTVEGFTYQIAISATKASTEAPADGQPAKPTAFLTVEVNAELPKERKKAADEKPEDAKSKDEAFTNRLKTLTEKLENEQKLSGRTFEIEMDSAEPLLVSRQSLIAPPPPPPGAARPKPPIAFPGAAGN